VDGEEEEEERGGGLSLRLYYEGCNGLMYWEGGVVGWVRSVGYALRW